MSGNASKQGLSFYSSSAVPLRLLLLSTILIFVSQIIIMLVLSRFSPVSQWLLKFIEFVALSFIVFPVLYLFLYHYQAKSLIENQRIIKENQESEIKYETLVAASPDCIKLFDIEGKLVYLNHSSLHPECKETGDGKKWFGYLESLMDEDQDKFKKAIKDALLGKKSVIEIRHKPGSDREVCMEMMAPLKDAEGKIIGIFGVSRDVTKYKRLEKTKEALTQMIAHDLNNPLTAALGNVQLLELELRDNLPQGQKEGFRRALFGLEEIKAMVNNLLDVSMMEESKLALRKKSVDVYSEAEKIKNLMEYSVGIEGKSLDLKLAAGLPALYADEEILGRIISNLIRNAIKFTPSNTSIEVGVNYNSDKKEFLFSVKDHGVGIPKDYLEKVFDKYVRIDNDRTKAVAGKGLGLTFCKMAVESHGGRIWVESEPGKGSTFYFTMPLLK